MEASLKAKELLMQHYEKVSGMPMNTLSKMVQFFNTDSHYKTAKECALITIGEIDAAIDFDWMEVQNLDREHNYWQQVKNELNNL
jgi:hypothetical protein